MWIAHSINLGPEQQHLAPLADYLVSGDHQAFTHQFQQLQDQNPRAFSEHAQVFRQALQERGLYLGMGPGGTVGLEHLAQGPQSQHQLGFAQGVGERGGSTWAVSQSTGGLITPSRPGGDAIGIPLAPGETAFGKSENLGPAPAVDHNIPGSGPTPTGPDTTQQTPGPAPSEPWLDPKFATSHLPQAGPDGNLQAGGYNISPEHAALIDSPRAFQEVIGQTTNPDAPGYHAGTVYKVGLENNTVWAVKPLSGEPGVGNPESNMQQIFGANMFHNEFGVGGVANALGASHLVPTTVPFNGSDGIGSAQKWVNQDGLPTDQYHPHDRQLAGAIDYISGAFDRGGDNYRTETSPSNTPTPALTDNAASFPNGNMHLWMQSGFVAEQLNQPFAPEVQAKIDSVTPDQLRQTLTNAGVQSGAIDGAVSRLQEMQSPAMGGKGQITGEAWNAPIYGFARGAGAVYEPGPIRPRKLF